MALSKSPEENLSQRVLQAGIFLPTMKAETEATEHIVVDVTLISAASLHLPKKKQSTTSGRKRGVSCAVQNMRCLVVGMAESLCHSQSMTFLRHHRCLLTMLSRVKQLRMKNHQ
jgi:hypothetical protein